MSCVFCQRIKDGEFDERWQGVVNFEPLNPVVPGHMLFVPVNHVTSAATHPALAGIVAEAAARWARRHKEDANLITSIGPNATQTVFHLHWHYVPRAMYDGLALPWTGQER